MADLNLVQPLAGLPLFTLIDEYYDAAVMGEFVGRAFPGDPGARQGRADCLGRLSEAFEEASPTKELRDPAYLVVGELHGRNLGGYRRGRRGHRHIDPDSDSRRDAGRSPRVRREHPADGSRTGSAELRIGEALWRELPARACRRSRQWEKTAREDSAAAAELNDKIAQRRPELQATAETSLEILESGVTRMRKMGDRYATVPRAVLSLAQIYVDGDEALKAVALLDDPRIGVLADDRAAIDQWSRAKAARAGLSSYARAPWFRRWRRSKPRSTRADWLNAAQERSSCSVEQMGDTPENQQRLVEIFYGLARGLETQLKLLDKPEDRRYCPRVSHVSGAGACGNERSPGLELGR